MRCFYDADEQIELWGKYLAEELPAIYGEQAAAVVMFVSAEYAAPGVDPARTRVKTVLDHPDRLLIRCPVTTGERVPRSAQPGQIRLASPPDPLPDRGEPVVPGRVNAQTAIATRRASG